MIIFILLQLCCEYLEENLSVQNACDCMQAAVTYGQEELKEKVLIYIEQHTEVQYIIMTVNIIQIVRVQCFF